MKALFILNDPLNGTEHCDNVLRLARALVKADPAGEVTVFLTAAAILNAKMGQKTPDGSYNLARMLKRLVMGARGALLCGTCLDAPGLIEPELVNGACGNSMGELAATTRQADKTLVF
jgi:uncharacterized protein involved in oxidation of intracellular sulfur